MINWIKNNRLEAAIIIGLFILTAFLRFYRLPDYMTFLGDEGRDALMIKRILVEHDFPLLGPPTSVGNIYLGPLYYYMMAVPMAIWWLNPVAAVAMVATIGISTVFLIYFLAKRWFGLWPGLLVATLYSISPVNIIYSRSSWNPNPAPFFALLAVLGLDQARRTKNFRWFILTGGALAAAVQMHYLALILLPIFGLFWIFEYKKRSDYNYYTQGSIGAIIIFCFLISPLVIFDFRYNFLNYKAMVSMFSTKSEAISFNLFDKLSKVGDIYYYKLVLRYLVVGQNLLAWVVGTGILLSIGIFLKKRKELPDFWPYRLLIVWLLGGLIGLSFYKGEVYDHYLGFLNPAPYLLIGGLIGLLSKRLQIVSAALVLIVLGFVNLQKNPLLLAPNNQLQRTQDIARYIISKSDNKPFNFALIAKSNYDSAYQFYLDQYGHKVKVVPVDVTDQLFVVCEDSVCNPVVDPKYEIVGFGWTKVEWVQEVQELKVYKLIHNPDQPKK